VSVYIIRCRVEAASSVRAAVREEILFRGDFPPWDGRADAQWFDISSDHAPLARQVFYAAKPWIVARYDGQRWLVPTANGWRERAEKIT
jgi:hypothetical protein